MRLMQSVPKMVLKAPVVRSKQGSGVGALACSTKYYELFNTAFDAMKLTIEYRLWLLVASMEKSATYQ